MAAATAVFQALAPGDHVLAPKVMYWSLRNWLMNFATHWGLQVELIDMTDPAAVARARCVPGKHEAGLDRDAGQPAVDHHRHRRHRGARASPPARRVAVDSTVATPVLTRPLELGADLVMHAATKYLNGHSDVIAGALVTREDDDFWQAREDDARAARRRRSARSRRGCCCAACARCILRVRARIAVGAAHRRALRAPPRMSRRCSTRVCRMRRGHAVAARQMHGGFGGMLSIRVKGGEAAAIATAAHVELWKRATSLGGVESLIEHRASVEGAGTPAPPDLLRLSVGIEDTGDLIADLEQSLRQARG